MSGTYNKAPPDMAGMMHGNMAGGEQMPAESLHLQPEQTGLLIQLLRGLGRLGLSDEGAELNETENAEAAGRADQMSAGGADPQSADAIMELMQYRRSRR